jgi:hypothetical protein
MKRVRSACLVALVGLLFAPRLVSAQPPPNSLPCHSKTNPKCRSSVPEPATLLLLIPPAAILLRSRLKKRKQQQKQKQEQERQL